MANEIVVGVKPIVAGAVAGLEEEASGAIGVCWVTIDGKEVPCKKEDGGNLISVVLEADSGPLVVTLQLIASHFRTVHYLDPDHAPERFRS